MCNDYKLYILGDLHGLFSHLNGLISQLGMISDYNNDYTPIYIFQTGDFGFFPRDKFYSPFNPEWGLKEHPYDHIKVYFCDGNHDDHYMLSKLTDNEIISNIYYMKRGSTLTLPDGMNVLFMGGAMSIGIPHQRELITKEDMSNLPDINIDMVISHTCPNELIEPYLLKNSLLGSKLEDPSAYYLSDILKKYSPKYWYFGHWHQFKIGKIFNTHWKCLNKCDDYGWKYEFN